MTRLKNQCNRNKMIQIITKIRAKQFQTDIILDKYLLYEWKIKSEDYRKKYNLIGSILAFMNNYSN